MHQLWPSEVNLEGLDDAALAAIYAYPTDLRVPYVRVNFVTSLDGAVSVDGRSAGLGSPADKRVFRLLRALADVVLVGAGTVRAENYGGIPRDEQSHRAPAPIAVVTGSAGLDPTSRLLTETVTPPIVLTLSTAPQQRRAALAAAGADVVVLERLTPDQVLGELARRGLYRVLCEGGPQLFGELIAADAVDELCLTVAPLLTGGEAGRIATGPPGTQPRGMDLVSVLADNGVLLLRYRRALARPGPTRSR